MELLDSPRAILFKQNSECVCWCKAIKIAVFLDSFIFFTNRKVAFLLPSLDITLTYRFTPKMLISLVSMECISCRFLRLENIFPLLNDNDLSSSLVFFLSCFSFSRFICSNSGTCFYFYADFIPFYPTDCSFELSKAYLCRYGDDFMFEFSTNFGTLFLGALSFRYFSSSALRSISFLLLWLLRLSPGKEGRVGCVLGDMGGLQLIL